MGEVFSVNVSSGKGTCKHPVEKVHMIKGQGIARDAHFGFHHRQVSLLSWEEIEKQNSLLKQNGHDLRLNPGDFAENITTRKFNLSSVKVGDKIKVGDEVLLQVSQIGKGCHQECEISKKIGKCIMPKQGIFARVLRGGQVRRGNAISPV